MWRHNQLSSEVGFALWIVPHLVAAELSDQVRGVPGAELVHLSAALICETGTQPSKAVGRNDASPRAVPSKHSVKGDNLSRKS